MKTYLKFLSRNKGYTAINLIGFAVALAFVVLLGLYVREENSADKFHEKGDRIYMLSHSDGHSIWSAQMPGDLAERYPEIESFARTSTQRHVAARTETSEKMRANVLITDSTFFTIFSFPMAAGSSEGQLQSPLDVTLGEEFANRMFGEDDPIGQSILIEGEPRTVTGIVRKFPKSHFQTPDIIVRFDRQNLDEFYFKSGYRANFAALYLLERKGSDLPSRGGDMLAWFKEVFWIYQVGNSSYPRFIPITESYFTESAQDGRNQNTHNFINMLSAAVMVILLFALINYVNLSVAVGGFRACEAAMRRLLGGSRARLLRGYLLESVIFCSAAFVLALGLVFVMEPLFNGMMGSSVSLAAALGEPVSWAVLLGAVLVLGVVSGLAPAFIITRSKPIDVVRGEFTRRTRMVGSRLFIAFQFCLTIVLIGCAIVIGRQTHYMRTTDLGFDKTNLLYFDNTLNSDRLPGLRSLLMTIPGVEMVSFTSGSPFDGGNNNNSKNGSGRNISFQNFIGDSLLFDILDIEILRRTGTTAPHALWLNETAVRFLELAPDSLSFGFNETTQQLAGVVRDFHIRGMNMWIPPMVFYTGSSDEWPNSILVKITPGNPSETYQVVQKAYLDYNGGTPFESYFADEVVDSWYTDQRRTGRLIAGFSLLAVVISVMGLVAMTTYFMRQRQRDIAVRKVFGATSSQVMGRLVGSFMMLVLCAFVVAVPLIWFLMNRWLSTFAYHIKLGWVTFLLAGLIVAIVALLAVWSQSLAAARRNPVSSLRSE